MIDRARVVVDRRRDRRCLHALPPGEARLARRRAARGARAHERLDVARGRPLHAVQPELQPDGTAEALASSSTRRSRPRPARRSIYHRCGSVRIATTDDRVHQFQQVLGIAESLGVPIEIVSPERARELFPLAIVDDVLGGRVPADRRARRPHERDERARPWRDRRAAPRSSATRAVTGLERERGTWTVTTPAGDVRADHRRHRRRPVGARGRSSRGRGPPARPAPAPLRRDRSDRRARGAYDGAARLPRSGQLLLRAPGGRRAPRRPVRARPEDVGPGRDPGRLPRPAASRPTSSGSRTASSLPPGASRSSETSASRPSSTGRTATRPTAAA